MACITIGDEKRDALSTNLRRAVLWFSTRSAVRKPRDRATPPGREVKAHGTVDGDNQAGDGSRHAGGIAQEGPYHERGRQQREGGRPIGCNLGPS